MAFADTTGGNVQLGGSRARWQLIVVYRGRHCPICCDYLAKLKTVGAMLSDSGVELIAVSSDVKENAVGLATELGLDYPLAYGLSVSAIRALGLYLSATTPEQNNTGDRPPFAEPGFFLLTPQGKVGLVMIASTPYVRPELDLLLKGVVRMAKENYPIRGAD